MQLDFGFAISPPAPRAALSGRKGVRQNRAQQFEFPGFDRLQQHTYFFAAFADENATEAVREARRCVAARLGLDAPTGVPPRPHMSLLCLCRQSAYPLTVEAEQAAVDAARFVRLEPFDVMFDRALTFGRNARPATDTRPVVLTAAQDMGMRSLHRRLFEVLERARVIGSRLRPFTPHMTLFYDCVEVDEAVRPISVKVREFHLVHSLHGKSQYRIVGSFPLRG